MSSFTYDFSDFEGFAEKLRQSEQVVSQELRAGIDRTTLTGEGFTKENTPVRTGQLRRSIIHKAATYGGGVARGSWGTNTPYAKPVEDGRRGFAASPGKVLAFRPKGSTRVIFRKRVGPAKGHFMFRKAMIRIRPVHRREMDAAIKRIITRLGGAR